MGLLDETVSVPRRTMTLFFLIDTSGSMEGNKIGAVNDAVVNVLPMLMTFQRPTLMQKSKLLHWNSPVV